MRNLKKFLALVLAMMMVFSLMVTVNASSSFTDEDAIVSEFTEAVEVLNALEVFQGYPDGSFMPKQSIKRSEVAAIVYRMDTGDTDDSERDLWIDTTVFKDVTDADEWYAGAVGYCYSHGYMVGHNGYFRPDDPVTGYEALATILRAVGYDKKNEFQGSQWSLAVAQVATDRRLLTNVNKTTYAGKLNQSANRELVAELLFQSSIIPTVIWTDAFGYLTTNVASGITSQVTNPSLAGQTFGLRQITGELTGVSAANSTATVANYVGPSAEQLATSGRFSNNPADARVYTMTGTDVSWECIGYGVSYWGTPDGNTSDTNKYKALVGPELVGDSLYCTAGSETETTIADIADDNGVNLGTFTKHRANAGSTGVRVYFNGVEINVSEANNSWTASGSGSVSYAGYYYNMDRDNVYWKINTSTTAAGTPVNTLNGLKIDYIDNDGGGEAEVIAITEYTVAEVAAITDANSGNTGANGIRPNSHYFTRYNLDNNHRAVGPDAVRYSSANIVTSDELAVGDLVTYVEYDGYAYVTKAATEVGALDRINNLNNMSVANTYVIGGVEYELAADVPGGGSAYSQSYWRGVAPTRSDFGKTYIVRCDPYGYALQIEEYNDPDAYLFVVSMEHSVRGISDTRVIDSTGAVYYVDVDTGTNDDVNQVINAAGHVFRYTEGSDGYYRLIDDDGASGNPIGAYCVNKGVDVTVATLNSSTINLFDISAPTVRVARLTNSTIIVDARNIGRNTTEVTVYNGYSDLPPLSNAALHCVTDGNNNVTLAFLTNGSAAASATKFISYQTLVGAYTKDKAHLDVIANGEMDTIDLTQAQYDIVATYGVGIYEFSGNTLTNYTAFPEKWHDVSWVNNALIIDMDDNGIDEDNIVDPGFEYGDDVIFYALDIGNHSAYPYNPIWGLDQDSAKAYVVQNASGKVTEIYVVYGKEVKDNINPAGDKLTKNTTHAPGTYWEAVTSEGTYFVADGYVTSFEPFTTYTVNVYESTGLKQKVGSATYNELDIGGTVVVKLNGNFGLQIDQVDAIVNGKVNNSWTTSGSGWFDMVSLVGDTLELDLTGVNPNNAANLRSLDVYVTFSEPADDQDYEDNEGESDTRYDTSYQALGITTARTVDTITVTIDKDFLTNLTKADNADKVKSLIPGYKSDGTPDTNQTADPTMLAYMIQFPISGASAGDKVWVTARNVTRGQDYEPEEYTVETINDEQVIVDKYVIATRGGNSLTDFSDFELPTFSEWLISYSDGTNTYKWTVKFNVET